MKSRMTLSLGGKSEFERKNDGDHPAPSTNGNVYQRRHRNRRVHALLINDTFPMGKKRTILRASIAIILAYFVVVLLATQLRLLTSTWIHQVHGASNSTTTFDIRLTPGFKCLAEDDEAWAVRQVRINAFGGVPTHDAAVLSEGSQLRVRIQVQPAIQDNQDRQPTKFNVPVVFIRLQDRDNDYDYAYAAIATACKLNRDVYVLMAHTSNTTTSHFNHWVPPKCAKVRRFAMDQQSISNKRLKDRIATFARFYQHMSGNHEYFERFCIERWFLLEALVESEGLDSIFYADCDVLFLANASEEWSAMSGNCSAQIKRHCVGSWCRISGHSTYWSKVKLVQLSQFMVDAYNPALPYFEKIQSVWIGYQSKFQRQNKTVEGGISDMYLINMFKDIFNDGVCYDDSAYDWIHGFTESDFYQDELGLPYRLKFDGHNQLIPMKTIHFQGPYKQYLVECRSAIRKRRLN
jgi:hypothetical protein